MRILKLIDIVSTIVLIPLLLLVVSFFVVEAGLVDLTTDPVVHAPENTTGIPEIAASKNPHLDGKALEKEIYDEVNERRASNGREPLVHSERIRLISRNHSKDMAERDYYDHVSPDGQTPPDRHKRYDGCDHPNENIVRWLSISEYDIETIAQQIVEQWVNSEGHNKTLMSDRYHVTGVGIYVTEEGDLYVTQNFCREHPNA